MRQYFDKFGVKSSKHLNMTQEQKYVWLIKTIYDAKEISLDDISDKWREENGFGRDYKLPRATFYRWKDAIWEQHGINIIGNQSTRKFTIQNRDVIEKGTVIKWMLDTFATGTLINDNLEISNRILVNDIPSGNKYLKPIIDAMKNNRKIEIEYQQFGNEYSSTFSIEPYCVKLFESRWYVLGKNNLGDIRVYCLDRIHYLDILDDTFKLSKKFDEAFKFHYGIEIGNKVKPRLIELRFFGMQKEYIKSLPLHESQELKEETEKYADFTLYLAPTFDFQQKLLSFGSLLEVLKPKELRDKMKMWVSEMNKIYNC